MVPDSLKPVMKTLKMSRARGASGPSFFFQLSLLRSGLVEERRRAEESHAHVRVRAEQQRGRVDLAHEARGAEDREEDPPERELN